MTQAGAFFVTRANSTMDARRFYSAPTDRSTGIISDQQVMLNGHYSAKKYPTGGEFDSRIPSRARR